MRKMKIVTGLVLGFALVGCESATLAPEGEGDVQVGVQGSSVAESSGSRSLSGSGSGSAEGSVAVRARISLRTSAGTWVEVTRGAAQQTVRVDGRDGERVLASGAVAVGTYGRVRVEFEEIRASLTGEARIGLPLGEAEVSVGTGSDGRVVVEREVEVHVRSGAQARLTMNLNADTWLAQADPGSRTIAKGSFEGAVVITGN